MIFVKFYFTLNNLNRSFPRPTYIVLREMNQYTILANFQPEVNSPG